MGKATRSQQHAEVARPPSRSRGPAPGLSKVADSAKKAPVSARSSSATRATFFQKKWSGMEKSVDIRAGKPEVKDSEIVNAVEISAQSKVGSGKRGKKVTSVDTEAKSPPRLWSKEELMTLMDALRAESRGSPTLSSSPKWAPQEQYLSR